ncbi:type II secretion system protein [bacterium]|nr:type II secretion system protein [bacterium]
MTHGINEQDLESIKNNNIFSTHHNDCLCHYESERSEDVVIPCKFCKVLRLRRSFHSLAMTGVNVNTLAPCGRGLEIQKINFPSPTTSIEWERVPGGRVREGRGGKKVAFTLAEVLITIGIIGIVAAMTIPSLMTKIYKHQTESRLKDSFAIMANAVKLAEEEQGVGFDMTDVVKNMGGTWSPQKSAKVFDTYLAPHLKINFKYNQDECEKLIKYYPANGDTPYTDSNGACYSFMNGTSIAFWAGKMASDVSMRITFFIYTSPTKVKKIAGRDVFGFSIVNNENGLFIASQYPELTRDELKTKCGADNGRIAMNDGLTTGISHFCAALIRRDGWKIMDDYPVKF